jgi:hypothetical protein
MMKQNQVGKYIAWCDGDGCRASVNTGLRSIQQASNYLSREAGWESWPDRERGGWRNFCPDCIESGDISPDLEQAGIHFARRTIDDD